MSVISASHELRDGLGSAFAMEFNTRAAAACAEYGCPPLQINWAHVWDQAQNCFEGNRTLGQIVETEEPDFPAVAWWVSAGQDQNVQKPRTFSGQVAVSWRWWLAAPGKYNGLALTLMREALEAAMLGTLLSIDIPVARYRKDLTWGDPVEQQWVDQDNTHRGWVQEMQFNASFEVNV